MRVTFVLAVLVLGLVLFGCVQQPAPTATPSTTATAAPTASPSPTEAPLIDSEADADIASIDEIGNVSGEADVGDIAITPDELNV
jgi:PBP1b-binding outer membrane lipoprotein LpoB